MKEKIFAVATILIIIASINFNTVKMNRDINSIYEAVYKIKTNESIELTRSAANEAYDLFKKNELFIGLTVNHEDLSNIENCFAEIIGYLSVGDIDSAEVTKNRLINSLSHLRRLSGFNIDAII